mmetsp:Transcript_63789/g.201758  ORF Transcript_63789/g.201758 Transcript_63789/m.201758 type:complete len:335 (+) Transcript_63789:717-1721(+)
MTTRPLSFDLERPGGHRARALLREVPPDEAPHVHEDAALNPALLGELRVPQPAPLDGEAAAVLEGGGGERHALDAPVALLVLIEAVLDGHGHLELLLQVVQVRLPRAVSRELDHLARGVHLLPLVDRLDHVVARREPRLAVVVYAVEELRARESHGLLELRHLQLGGGLLHPAGVEPRHARGEVGVAHVLGRSVGVVLVDAVIDAVDGLHEVLVHLEVEDLEARVRLGHAEHTRHDLAPKVLVHQAGAGELSGEPVPKDISEPALVVVEAVGGGVVLPAHVNDHVELLEDVRVAAPHHGGVLEGRRALQEEAAQRLVAVEAPVVSADLHHLPLR